jgi:hypothetical protein
VIPLVATECIQCESSHWICDVGGFPIGAKAHARRHLPLPKCHWFAKNARLYPGSPKISRRGESVRSRANDYYGVICQFSLELEPLPISPLTIIKIST